MCCGWSSSCKGKCTIGIIMKFWEEPYLYQTGPIPFSLAKLKFIQALIPSNPLNFNNIIQANLGLWVGISYADRDVIFIRFAVYIYKGSLIDIIKSKHFTLSNCNSLCIIDPFQYLNYSLLWMDKISCRLT